MIHEELLDKIYKAPVDPDLWTSILDDVTAMLDARGSVLLVERNDGWVGWRSTESLKPQINHQIENHLDNKLDKTKYLTIHDLETRTLNGLYEYYLTNNLLDKNGNMLMENLKYVSKSKFSKLRNYGRKTLTELEDFAENRNIKLL